MLHSNGLRTRHLHPGPHFYRTVRIRILILLWRIKIKLLGGRIGVQYSDPNLPGLVRIIRASHSNDVRCPRWRGQSRKTTTGPKSGLKIKIYLKIKAWPPQVHREPGSANCGSGPTMEGTVQEDDYRTEVRFKDKIYLKIKALPPQVHREPGSANCGSGTRIRT